MINRPDPARWVAVLFAANFLLQRFSVPALEIPLTLPFTLGWLALALRQRVITIEKRRLTLWLLAGGGAAVMVLPQLLFVEVPYLSPMSWMLWMVIWIPVAFHARDRSLDTFRRTMSLICRVGIAIATLSVVFTGAQLAGWAYRDLLSDVVPAPLLMHDYVITYPVQYGSPLYRSNAFLALEPSFLSFTLALCMLAGLMSGARRLTLALLGVGLLCTTAASGIIVLVIAVLAMVVRRQVDLIRPYALFGLVVAGIAALTPFGAQLLGRVGEGADSRSSLSLRSTEPYGFLWPHWVDQPAGILFGHGAGSSQWLVAGTGIVGLLLPSVAKVLFDYGIVAGALLIALLIGTFIRSPAPAIAFALAVSMLTVQSASQPLIVCCVALVTMWSPASVDAEQGVQPGEAGGRVEGSERGPVAAVGQVEPQLR